MAVQQLQTVRNPPPRMLQMNETLHSLNHWKTAFRTYYRRDSYFKAFLLPEATWTNSSQDNYGQTADMSGANTIRSAVDKGEDLRDFLHTLAGYLPFPYLAEKIVNGSTNLQQVWDTIYDHFGVSVSSETLLDYVGIKLNPGETYRQFFDRLLAHARLHLPKEDITVDGINTGRRGEAMTVALMNFIAMDWLNKINPHLISIVKTEYSKELRENVQLAELVPRIANNVDAMLSRHDVVGGVEKLTVVDDEMTVDRVNKVNYRKKISKGNYNSNKKKLFCPECQFLSKKLALNIDYRHSPADCPRPRAAVNLLLAGENDNVLSTEEECDYTGKDSMDYVVNCNEISQMRFSGNIMDKAPAQRLPSDHVANYSAEQTALINCAELYNSILSLEARQHQIRKEYSPQLRTKIGNIVADSVIDEGSELNCICSSVVAKCNIKYNPIKINAMAAGSNVMKLLGVVPTEIILDICDTSVPTKIILKQAVVVKNLGPNILIGEPGKMDNGIVTFPKQKLIQLETENGNIIKLPYHSHNNKPSKEYQAYSVKKPTILYPGENLSIPIPPSMQCNAVNVTMRREFAMCEPVIDNANKTYVNIQNTLDRTVFCLNFHMLQISEYVNLLILVMAWETV